jgi:hypothetical protein
MPVDAGQDYQCSYRHRLMFVFMPPKRIGAAFPLRFSDYLTDMSGCFFE